MTSSVVNADGTHRGMEKAHRNEGRSMARDQIHCTDVQGSSTVSKKVRAARCAATTVTIQINFSITSFLLTLSLALHLSHSLRNRQ